MPIMLVVRTS